MTLAKRKIILSGLLGIISIGMLTTSVAAENVRIERMTKSAFHENLGKAIATNDYDAFASALQGKPGAKTITQHHFDAFVQAYRLHAIGADEHAQKILTKAGLTK